MSVKNNDTKNETTSMTESASMNQNTFQNINNVQQKEKTIQKQLTDSFKNIGTVSFDAKNKTYSINITDNDTQRAIDYVSQNPKESEKLGFNKLKNTSIEISNSIAKNLGSGYKLVLINQGKNVLSIEDGKVLNGIA